MQQLEVVEVNRDGILESAATVCYNRAEEWCHQQQSAFTEGNKALAETLRLRRDEADACKFAIRQLKTIRASTPSERDILKNVVLNLNALAKMTDRPEYKQGLQIFTAMYAMMAEGASLLQPVATLM